jgi:hypothetical protein
VRRKVSFWNWKLDCCRKGAHENVFVLPNSVRCLLPVADQNKIGDPSTVSANGGKGLRSRVRGVGERLEEIIAFVLAKEFGLDTVSEGGSWTHYTYVRRLFEAWDG